ncbi:enamine deaminase RidA (YjgF/YER057c/UK114 family) [Bradyrhizobium sp. USDA 4524]|nr:MULTISPECIES: RidA family protein [unclassified Bradyrhizobium]MCP1846174.1 enamine deaminase RidA (YjgF/YER057c/UK114 family) [Bradyrhizobium sp. USDA 4538]MCP1985667.1 enamine deaminase RidA (YjgF/YER057c/UK114 family) [Bradyrhizobium sp. USDA 4539]
MITKMATLLSCWLVIFASTFAGARAQNLSSAEARLREKNITLPADAIPAGNYVNAVQVGNLLFLAGNASGGVKGKVGRDLTVEQGYDAARQAGLIMLAKVRAALGGLDRVKRVVKVVGMVNSADDFTDQPKVVNGFSDLMVEVFGASVGKHARSSLGVAALPNNAPVEVEMILEIDPVEAGWVLEVE